MVQCVNVMHTAGSDDIHKGGRDLYLYEIYLYENDCAKDDHGTTSSERLYRLGFEALGFKGF